MAAVEYMPVASPLIQSRESLASLQFCAYFVPNILSPASPNPGTM